VATKISTGDKYSGEFRNGKFESRDANLSNLRFANGASLCKGKYEAGVLTKGRKESKTGKYEGEFKNNEYHGKGEFEMNNGDVYVG